MKTRPLNKVTIKLSGLLKLAFYVALGYFSYLMLLITAQYIPIQFDAAFLAIKEEEILMPYYQVSFFTHVYSSIFILLLGCIQFSKRLRAKFPMVHRTAGKIYIALILCLAGPSGFVMAIHANGGIFAQLSFSLLSLFWMYFTFRAYHFARKKDWKKHSRFMYRSYALTLSAISLRLFKWIIAGTLALPPMDTYQIVAWAGWIVNWMIVELIIIRNPNLQTANV